MKVVYEDNHLIIVNKDPGELSQSDYTKDQSLVEKVKNYLRIKYQKKGNVFLGLVNRLDRPTSGLLIFSKTFFIFVLGNTVTCFRFIFINYLKFLIESVFLFFDVSLRLSLIFY